MVTILLVDDHAHILKGLEYLLEAAPDIQVLGTASNGLDAVAMARLLQPDVVIMDISMPLMSGIEATKRICECCAQTHVLALSINDNPNYVRHILEAGASGYLLKDKIGYELVEAIRIVHSGKRYLSRTLTRIISSYIGEDIDSWVG